MLTRTTILLISLALLVPPAFAGGGGGRKGNKGKSGGGSNKKVEKKGEVFTGGGSATGSGKSQSGALERCDECEAKTFVDHAHDAKDGNSELLRRKALRTAQVAFAKEHASDLGRVKQLTGEAKAKLTDAVRERWLAIRSHTTRCVDAFIKEYGEESIQGHSMDTLFPRYLQFARTWDGKSRPESKGGYQGRGKGGGMGGGGGPSIEELKAYIEKLKQSGASAEKIRKVQAALERKMQHEHDDDDEGDDDDK